jgi:hypothetical protein
VNTKFRGYLVDGKVLFNRSRRLGLLLHLITMSWSGLALMNRFYSRAAFSERQILMKVTFTDYSPASYLVVPKLAAIYQVPNLRLTNTDNRRCFSDREFWLGYFWRKAHRQILLRHLMLELFALHSIHLLGTLAVHEPPSVNP